MTNELPMKGILQFLVKEGVALDRDKARQAIEQEIGPLSSDTMISFHEFQKIFCRGIFKQAIIRSAEEFLRIFERKGRLKDLNLKQKINMYQRN